MPPRRSAASFRRSNVKVRSPATGWQRSRARRRHPRPRAGGRRPASFRSRHAAWSVSGAPARTFSCMNDVQRPGGSPAHSTPAHSRFVRTSTRREERMTTVRNRLRAMTLMTLVVASLLAVVASPASAGTTQVSGRHLQQRLSTAGRQPTCRFRGLISIDLFVKPRRLLVHTRVRIRSSVRAARTRNRGPRSSSVA